VLDLVAKSPASGLLPLTIGALELVELTPAAIFSLATRDEKTLEKALGLSLPAPNQTTSNDKGRLAWFGHAHWLWVGEYMPLSAYVTDQSDAWSVVELRGNGARDALARLTPLDLRDAAFAIDATARTELQHMSASITRTAVDSYMIMVFRSMAKTLVHDLETAMKTVASK
jgi:sarcosine oxidase subunit gamma